MKSFQLNFKIFHVLVICFGIFNVSSIAIAEERGAYREEIERCASTVDPETMSALIATESHGNQFAIADAGPVNLPWAKRKYLVRSYFMKSEDDAIQKATDLISNGHTVSLGLTQVNDRNLSALGLTLNEVFDVCTNLAAGAKILTTDYKKAVRKYGHTSAALRAALSRYNSGDWYRGEKDGYVDLIYSHGTNTDLKTDHPAMNVSYKKYVNRQSFTMSVSNFEQ